MRPREDDQEEQPNDAERVVLTNMQQAEDELFWKRVYLAAVSTAKPDPAGSADEAVGQLKERRARNWAPKAPGGEDTGTD